MTNQTRITACGALLLIATGLATGQTTPIYVPDNLPSSGGGNVIPWGLFTPPGAFTYVGGISASFLNPAVPLVHEVSFAPWASGGSPTGTFQCSNIQMGFGHVATPLPQTFTYPSFNATGNVTALGSFLDYTPIWNSVSQGPFSWPWTYNTWSPMGFAALGGTSFIWNGTNDIAFYVTWTGATGLTACWTQGQNPLRRWNTGVYQAPASNGGDTVGLKMKLDMRAAGPAVYQVNQPGAVLTVNGVTTAGWGPATVNVSADNVCLFGTVTVNWNSTYLGLPFDIGLTASPLVPAGAGGFTTAGGGVVNLNLGDPSLAFLFGLGFATPFFNATFPYTPPTAPMSLSAQMFVLDGGTSVDGYRLSQGSRYSVTPSSTVLAGPTGNDSYTTYSLGQGALCTTGSSMPFYGQSLTQISVSTNGRIMWNGANANPTPSVAGAMSNPGMVGAWCDLYVGYSNSVVNVTNPTTGVFRADWVGVPYYPGTGSATFGIQLDTSSGFLAIDGLNFSGQGGQMLVGVSKGSGATDAGQTNYGSVIGLGTQAGPGGNAMIYKLGSAATPVTGCTMIIFLPDGAGNYHFAVF